MSKVAEYLQSHIIGEVSIRKETRALLSRDGSVMEITPEVVVYPRVTNDIRKINRFAWQLAEKGHILPVTARGGGSDQTGAALTSGLSMVLPAHMDEIYEYEPKQKLVRVQPGANMRAVNQALALHHATIPAAPVSASFSTIGGAVANNASGRQSGYYGPMRDFVHQLEVVLSNGDVIQTGRISKRELNRKKGQQGFEGDIYRGIDAVIEDNEELIAEQVADGQLGNFGYAIADVKKKDGSFDLTPLFIGSQGTLGVVSELIMRCEHLPRASTYVAITFQAKETARDALDILRSFKAVTLDYYDGEIFAAAEKAGRKFKFYQAAKEIDKVNAVVLMQFIDHSDRARMKKIKKIQKQLQREDIQIFIARDEDEAEMQSVAGVTHYFAEPPKGTAMAMPVVDGFMIPHQRFDEFYGELAKLSKKLHLNLPLYGHANDGVYYARPLLDLHKVSDKQKILKLLDDMSKLVDSMNGIFVAESGEGRLKTRFASRVAGDSVNEMFAQVKKVFDPFGILNPGVKQVTELKAVADHLSSSYMPTFLGNHDVTY